MIGRQRGELRLTFSISRKGLAAVKYLEEKHWKLYNSWTQSDYTNANYHHNDDNNKIEHEY